MLHLTWRDFDLALRRIVPLVPRDAVALLPIPRGGLILATALSHLTGLPLLLDRCGAPVRRGAVLVDDIVDSGRTLVRWREALGPLPCLAWLQREGMTADGVR